MLLERSKNGSTHRCIPIEPSSITQAQRQQLLVDWNKTSRPYPREACFHELFEQQAARSPDRLAAEYYGKVLTYKELDERANRWAAELRHFGVDRDVPVGVCIEPSLELPVALLSVLKAGGAYVPLDPTYPAKRLSFMLQDAALGIVLTSEATQSVLPQSSARLLPIKNLGATPATQVRPKVATSAESLAYVIYTSGSTGRPKGAMITHRGLVNYLTWAADAYQVSQGTGAPVCSSISFDLTVTGLFAPLLTGGCVTLLSTKDPLGSLTDVLKRRANFSLVKITPAHLDLLRTRLSSEDLRDSTRVFVIGGEALTGESLRFWQEKAPGIALVNEYGPTETVVGCCVYFVPRAEGLGQSVPIGRPIANTQLFILDASLEPVPIGTPGELYIGGDGVAKGYLNRPDLTAQRFISNPFINEVPDSSPTLYRTGDLARYRPDGNIEFLGRIDHQVKVHGYRIETGEIEAVLSSFPPVQAAVVAPRIGPGGDRYLAAYLAVPSEGCFDEAALRAFLSQQVPGYMIPAEFFALHELPLTTNGKVDREALARLERPARSAPFVFHQGNTVQRVIEIWEKLLGCQGIEADDNFFELGGNSLLAVHLVVEINRVFRRDFHSLDLYKHPTVGQLAEAIETPSRPLKEPVLLPMLPGRNGRSVFVMNVSAEMVALISRLKHRPESFQISHEPWQKSAIEASKRKHLHQLPSLPQIAAPHTAKILANGLLGRCLLAGFSYGGPLAFEVAHQLIKAGVSIDAVILLDADLRIPPLRRMTGNLVRHLKKALQQSVGLLHRKERVEQRRRTAGSSTSADPIVLDAADHIVPWEHIQRIWLQALRKYRPRPLPARGFLIRAAQTSYSSAQDYDGCLGWRGLFKKGLVTVTVPGDHFTMWRPPHSEALVGELNRALDSLGA
jgi:amino acid adenylation domain-containing protein